VIWPVRHPSRTKTPTEPDCCRGLIYRRFALFPTIIGERFDTKFPKLRLIWLRWYWKRGYYSRGRKTYGQFFVAATGDTLAEVLPRRASHFSKVTISGRLFWVFMEMHPALPDCDSQIQHLDMTGIEAAEPKFTEREWFMCRGEPKQIGEAR
jgi:hypothetical protein